MRQNAIAERQSQNPSATDLVLYQTFLFTYLHSCADFVYIVSQVANRTVEEVLASVSVIREWIIHLFIHSYFGHLRALQQTINTTMA